MITSYHAHVYFDLSQTALAERVRQRLIEAIPTLTYSGQLIPKLVGPHPKPMFEIHIPANVLNTSMVKMDALRENLDILIHPVNNDPLAAHTTEAQWLGHPLPLNTAIFDSL